MVNWQDCGNSIIDVTEKLTTVTVIDDRYIIVKVLGMGGMGAVYQALDRRLNNIPVAIKEMRTNTIGESNSQAAIAKFKQEAAMLISLKHPALPIIRDFFSKGDQRWYLVMDYIEGENLKAIKERRGLIPEVEVIEWAKQLCEILQFLHGQNPPVIFRDLKPANIMLTPENKIKLIDFGIARHFRSGQSSDTTTYVSRGFAPPEQYGQNQTDARSDIYALGATIHYLLTGIDPDKNPFKFEPPSKHVKILPEFEAAIIKALEFNPEKRFASIMEMYNSLTIPYQEQELDADTFFYPQNNQLPEIFYLFKKLIMGTAIALCLIGFVLWVGVWEKAEFKVGQETLGFPVDIVQEIRGWLDSTFEQ